ncbi:MAG: hypothetical protein KAG28_03470 [Cocleimonas sp.]|nr:hypothetical protein [Cocleimonas sp.]
MDSLEEIADLNDDIDLGNIEELTEKQAAKQAGKKNEKRVKPHIIRRNVEDYLAQRALERRLRDVFDYEYDY